VACAQTKEVKEIIEGCIDKLPNDRQREMAYLRWIRGFSRKDIAETMKVSIGCVDNDLASAREALRDDLIPFAQDL
jgi:DNA-directed RNA polymerase specialized sigma24 family protein